MSDVEAMVAVSASDLGRLLTQTKNLCWMGAWVRLRAALDAQAPERCPSFVECAHGEVPLYAARCRFVAGHHEVNRDGKGIGGVAYCSCGKPADDPVHAAPEAPRGCRVPDEAWVVEPR